MIIAAVNYLVVVVVFIYFWQFLEHRKVQFQTTVYQKKDTATKRCTLYMQENKTVYMQ